ncbi:probable polygalacturonase At3g15720 [Trifolium pratense]|uniref:probable polygalacturonase At3g15720 n=1 Tax=Trifolium pratense TaxID=57577 RepID=UPI001E6964FE|nr:probable polygalacturonase At3g15720 [Trifolium pratense]
MQGFIIFVLIFGFISPCLCTGLNVETKNNIFNVLQYGARGDAKSDDSQAFLSAWRRACKAVGMSTLVIPAGKSFMVTKLNFNGPCTAKILIQLEGEIIAPPKAAWKGGLIWISVEYVNGLTIDGNNQGILHGQGPTWWQCPTCNRPMMLFFHSCKSLNVRKLRIRNSPRSHISITMCQDATFSYIAINSPVTSPNTDGFDIAHSSNILIEDSYIKSGDDCIALNGGSFFVNATRVTCGPGHGISVGSLGRNGANDQVSNIYVRNCTFIGTTNGARIKTFSGGSGYAKQITFEQIILVNVLNPIIIDQNYHIVPKETDVSVSDVTYRGFTGTSASDVAIALKCRKKTSSFCINAHGSARNTIPSVSCLK